MPIEPFDRFTPAVHPGAYVHPGAWVLGEVRIDEGASVWPGAVLRGDNGAVHLGARSSFQDGSVAHGTEGVSRTTIGQECTIGHRVVLHGCTVADHCLVGTGSVVLDGVELGEWCFVGASTLLTPNQKVPPRSFILGHPGKRVREVSATDLEAIAFGPVAYQDLLRRYRAGR